VYRLHPVDKNKVLVRLEYLADKFDHGKSTTFDLEKFARELYAQANPGKNLLPKISEMAIDGVQTKKDLLAALSSREEWLSEDSATPIEEMKEDKTPLNALKLEPSAIRTFMLDYSTE
jgi:hypothetical protein